MTFHEVHAVIQFCDQLKNKEIQTLDIDQCLEQMNDTGAAGLITSWINDYKKVVEANADREFTLIGMQIGGLYHGYLFHYNEKT